MLVALRLGIGWHFFREGVDKVQDGFSAAGFLRNAKGPFAPLYLGMLPDEDGLLRLNYDPEMPEQYNLDRTIGQWRHFHDRAAGHFSYGDKNIEQRIQERRTRTEQRIKDARAAGKSEAELVDDRRSYEADGEAIRLIRRQPELAKEILSRAEAQLRTFYAENSDPVQTYFKGLERRDKNRRDPARLEVASLREQSDKIVRDLKKDVRPWLGTIDKIWDGLETELNDLATPDQKARGRLHLPRPGEHGMGVEFANRMIPRFDLIIGILLVLGLFTRPVAVLGALFLASVMLAQWPFAYGAAPIYNQFVEACGLLLLATTGAGRFAGLDFFLRCLRFKCCPPKQSPDATP